MAMSKQYLSVGGEVLMESGTTEEERIMYIRDGMGSVVATADSKGNVLNTYMYKPSGAVWQKTGSAPDPRFLWCGTWGYRAGGSAWNSHYVRARHYSHNSGAWTTVDPLWPSEPAYRYVGGREMSAVDPSGMVVQLCSRPILRLAGQVALTFFGECFNFGGAIDTSRTYEHWYLRVKGSCDTTMGWGPNVTGPGTGGLYGVGGGSGNSANLGYGPGDDPLPQDCVTLDLSSKQEKCLCANWNMLTHGQRAGDPAVMCGRTWTAANFNNGTEPQVCQNFIECLLSKCGIKLPIGWNPLFGTGD